MGKTAVVLLGGLLYISATTYLITKNIPHFELLALSLQLFVLLPAIYFGLRRPGGVRDGVPGLRAQSVRPAAVGLIGFFTLIALAFSYLIGQGIVFADESSYRFQAQLFDSFSIAGEPPPGATTVAAEAPQSIAFKHLVVSHSGWFSKYPIGWPLVLSIAEKFDLGWAANPLLGALLLFLLVCIAREAYGENTVAPALWMAVFSPYLLSYCTGRMSHAFCAVLIAFACWSYLRGIRTSKLSPFCWMFVALIVSFHVRPFTAFLLTGVFSMGLLLNYRKNRPMLAKVATLIAIAGIAAVVSVMLYNHAYTGRYLLSPYALYDGTEMPTDVQTSPGQVLSTILSVRRFSVQTTLLYSFPFVFALAAYGFWKDRFSPSTRILGALFPAVFAGYMAQTVGTAPIVGERYYFETYFAVIVLAAKGLQMLLQEWRSRERDVIWSAVVLTAVQLGMLVVGADQIARVAKPYREVSRIAETLRDCECAVFLKSTAGHEYFSPNLNLNTPEWKRSRVFYFNDPGDTNRSQWASKRGWNRWVLVTYDIQKQTATEELFHNEPVTARLSQTYVKKAGRRS